MIVIVLPEPMADQRLLTMARSDPRTALQTIYERYFPPVYQFIRLRVNEREQAQDIAAEVFLDLFVTLRGRGNPPDNLRAWLFRVARNKIYDHYGAKKNYPTETIEEWVPASMEDSPEANLLRSMQAARTRRVLGMLADEQQEVLILRFGQGLSLQETADLMDKSVSAVKSLQFRAVDTLRRLLNAGGTE